MIYQAQDKVFIAAYLRWMFGYRITGIDLDVRYNQWALVRKSFFTYAVAASQTLVMAGKSPFYTYR